MNKKLTPHNYASREGATIKYLVIHDTGVNGQTAKNNADYFYTAYRGASAHYFVDENEVWQVVEDKNASWHCGDGNGKYGITNQNSIGIEMCPKNSKISGNTQTRTVNLAVELMKKYNIPIERVVRHYDASRKNCPQFLNNDKKWTDWFAFKKKIEGAINVAEYWDKKGWYEMIKDDTFYTSPSFTDKTVSGWKLAKGSRFYVDEVVWNPSKTARRGVVLKLGGAGKRYMSLNKTIVKKV